MSQERRRLDPYLHRTIDADAWAREFMKLWSGHVVGEAEVVDQELMRGWFANAIMAGWDHACSRVSQIAAAELRTEQESK